MSKSVVTGVALIVLPFVGLAIKMISFGWMMVILLMGPVILLLAGYVLQVVIAVQGFIAKKQLFAASQQLGRAMQAAWLSMCSFLLLCFFMPDGGDSSYGSTFQLALKGIFGDDDGTLIRGVDTPGTIVASLAAAVWLGSFIWLFILWIKARAHHKTIATQL